MKTHVKLIVLSILITFFTIGSLAVAANKKALICHIPPGNPQNYHTIYISERAVRAHLNHGDMEGPCTDFCADLCDDNDPCTEDLCDGSRGCDNTVLIDCKDDNPCTNEFCDDGIYCNGDEFCVEGECQEGTPPTCDDGIDCTDDSCDPDLDACQNVPDDDACDNDLLCDGEEICDPGSGCLPGEEHCPGMECDEDSFTCVAMNRFTDNGDGTVTDNQTGMIWLKNGNCFGLKTWDQSLSDYIELADGVCGLTDGSLFGDWRLPTREEWEAFVCGGECLNRAMYNAEGSALWPEEDPFSSVQPYYWSSSEYDLYNVWYMDMRNGSIYMIDKSVPLYVWPVRDETVWVIGVRSN